MDPTNVVILAAARTPIGSFGGALKDVSAARLGVAAARAAIARAGLTPDMVDEAIVGCARQAGNGPNIARQVAFHGGVPADRPAFTVNKACASGLKAVTLAAQSIMTGENGVVLAGGVEQMSQIPYLLLRARWGYRLGDDTLVDAMYRDGYLCPLSEMVMGETAELLAERYGISRAEQDEFAAASNAKAIAAWEAGAFAAEVVPVEAPAERGGPVLVERDERPRADATLERLARLKPAFKPTGTITAGNASGITDGAAMLVLASAERARELGAAPLARLRGLATAAVPPREMGLSPVPATAKLLAQTGLALADFDLIEINEAFAAQVLAVEREIAWDPARRNVHGGAVALGHPTGCSGARILTTLLHALRTHGLQLGLATLCVSGGPGMAVAVEVL